MKKFIFNKLQNEILNYQKIYPNSKAFYQKIDIESNINAYDLYINLLNKFPILKAVIDFNETYSINEKIISSNISIIKNLNHHEFTFDYKKYLFSILYNNNTSKKILIFHHLFIDATSENIIYNYINTLNNNNSNNKNYTFNIRFKSNQDFVDVNKYYTYTFSFPTTKNNIGNKNYVINKKTCNELIENKGDSLNLILKKDTCLKEFCNKLNITSHTYYVGILALTMKMFINDNRVIIYDMFSGREEKYKQTIGFFSYSSQIIVSIKNSISNYFKLLNKNIKSNIKVFSTNNNKDIIINDVRKIPLFQKSKLSQSNGNDIPNQLSLKIISDEHILFQYNTNIIDKNAVLKIMNLYEELFYNIINMDINTDVNEINFIPNKDQEQILKWGRGNIIKPINETIYDLIDRNISNNIAVSYRNSNITYKILKEKTDSISNYFKNKDLFQKSIIMSIDRDENIPLYILGIMKSGNIYIPLLPSTPYERFKYIISDTNAKLIITNKKYKDTINSIKLGVEVFYIEDFIFKKYPNKNIINPKYSYIIYTSGTSGDPKGIKFTHFSLTNGINSYLSIFPKYNSLYSTQIIWDPNFKELFLPLLNNKTVFICNNIITDKIPDKVEWINGTPDILKICEIPNNIKLITTAGSKINKSYWNNVKHIKNIWSLYGPTESFDVATVIRLKKYDTTLGSPFPNYNIYVIKDNKFAPINVLGEICIGTIALGEEYINKPNLTNQQFISFNGERIYKTGDYGKWTETGKLEFHGRIDNQIKFNGIRIELNEIETKINNIQGINQCCVLFHKNKLYCFSTPIININIRNKLIDKLPKYMIPSFYYKLKTLPLTITGKLDKKNLLQLLNKYDIDDDKYKIITDEISKYIDCTFAAIKKFHDNFTDKHQLCLYINTKINISLIDIFDKLIDNLNPYWVIKIDDNLIDNLNLPKPNNENTYRELFINKYKNIQYKNIYMEIYDMLCQTLNVNKLENNVSLEYNGVDSLNFIRLENIFKNKYNIEININDSYNSIIEKINNSNNKIHYCNFIKNPNIKNPSKILVLFKGAANNIPVLLINKKSINSKLFSLDCDFLIVTNYDFVKNGTYDSKILENELIFYKKKYEDVYFISNSAGWKSCVHFSNLSKKLLISGGGYDSQNLITNETINIIKKYNNKIHFYYGNNKDLEVLTNFEILHSIQLNKYENIFFKEKTHGIFTNKNKINEYTKFIKDFINYTDRKEK